MDGHYLKHKSENSSWVTVRNYTNSAVCAVNLGESYTIRNGQNAGRSIYYREGNCTGTQARGVFAVTTQNGTLISAFVPSQGKKYFDNQVQRDKTQRDLDHLSFIDGENDDDIWTIYDTYQCNPHDEN